MICSWAKQPIFGACLLTSHGGPQSWDTTERAHRCTSASKAHRASLEPERAAATDQRLEATGRAPGVGSLRRRQTTRSWFLEHFVSFGVETLKGMSTVDSENFWYSHLSSASTSKVGKQPLGLVLSLPVVPVRGEDGFNHPTYWDSDAKTETSDAW